MSGTKHGFVNLRFDTGTADGNAKALYDKLEEALRASNCTLLGTGMPRTGNEFSIWQFPSTFDRPDPWFLFVGCAHGAPFSEIVLEGVVNPESCVVVSGCSSVDGVHPWAGSTGEGTSTIGNVMWVSASGSPRVVPASNGDTYPHGAAKNNTIQVLNEASNTQVEAIVGVDDDGVWWAAGGGQSSWSVGYIGSYFSNTALDPDEPLIIGFRTDGTLPSQMDSTLAGATSPVSNGEPCLQVSATFEVTDHINDFSSTWDSFPVRIWSEGSLGGYLGDLPHISGVYPAMMAASTQDLQHFICPISDTASVGLPWDGASVYGVDSGPEGGRY